MERSAGKREKARAFFFFRNHFLSLPLFPLTFFFSPPPPHFQKNNNNNSYFTTSLLLGTPPKPFSVIVDTGSTLTYVACAGCASSGDCGPRHASGPSGFDAAESATSRRVECGDAERCSCGSRQQCGCEALNGSPDSLEASLEGNCTWIREYAEESSASGRLVTDVVTLPLVGARKISASKTSSAAAKADGNSNNNEKKGEKKPAQSQSQSPPLPYRRVPLTFGCTTRETGEIFQQVADGILGMGASSTGFPSQLGAAGALEWSKGGGNGKGGGSSSSSSSSSLPPLPTEDAPPPFSLCMGGPEGGGALLLGPWLPEMWVKVNGSSSSSSSKNKDKDNNKTSPPPPSYSLPKGKKPLVQTPLVPSPGHPYYYAVGLESISFNGKPLEGFDASVFREGHGSVLDSGTTFTYLPGAVFDSLEKVVRAAAKAAKLPVVPGAGGGGEGQQQSSYGDLCWGGLEGGEEAVRRHFPRMQLRFAAEEGAAGGGGAFGGKAAAPSTSTSSSSVPVERPKRILRRRRRRRRRLEQQESDTKKKARDEKAAPSSDAKKKTDRGDAGTSPPASTPQQQKQPKLLLRRRPPLPAAELDLPPLNYLFAHVSRPGAYCLGE